ncbi:hypothetical protein KAR91_39680, partial [Candidatus Pacearchaeota archaeon]|nr:hypothetical protein [Candidatus Pacearchaeota archaeon]
MPFIQFKLDRSVNQSRDIFDKYIYRPDNGDTLADIFTPGYFERTRFINDWVGSIIEIYGADGYSLGSIGEGGTVTPITSAVTTLPTEYIEAGETSFSFTQNAILWCLNDDPATADLSGIEAEGAEAIILARNAPVSVIGTVNTSTAFMLTRQFDTAHLRYSAVTGEWGL